LVRDVGAVRFRFVPSLHSIPQQDSSPPAYRFRVRIPSLPKSARSFAEALTLSSSTLIVLSSQGQNSIDYMDTSIPIFFFYPVAD
jgi:hypothetical protein